MRWIQRGGLGVLLSLLVAAAGNAWPAPDYTQERKAYQTALSHLSAGRLPQFRAVRDSLRDYPLLPYLDYHALKRRLATLSVDEINTFEATYPDLPVAGQIREDWLEAQAAKSNWAALLKGYPADDRAYSVELQCYHARAEIHSGARDNGLAAAQALWLSGKSQPIACDPLFTTLRQSGRITQELTWERMELAFAAGSIQLGRHLISRLNGEHRVWGEAYYQVHRDPRRVLVPSRFSGTSRLAGRVVLNGMQRLATQDPTATLRIRPEYGQRYTWTAQENAAIDRGIWKTKAVQGQFPGENFNSNDPELLAALVTAARNRQQWPDVERFIGLMPDGERARIEWQYWLGRAIEENHGAGERSEAIFQGIAGERHYYGFLAAGKTGTKAQLVATPADNLGRDALNAMHKYPNGARGLEFFALNEQVNARREWLFGVDNLGPEAAREFTYAALHQGHPHLAIFFANRAGLLDDIAVRFPMLYQKEFETAANQTRLPLPLLFAIARQESAFDRHARSVADARGLMQLLPSTARWIAEQTRQRPPSEAALYEPSTNIRLGSSFLAGLLRRYQNQLPLAAAAYNAGEGRVRQWTANISGMPMDVWIETIPFSETRNYVKNVVAFRVVYGLLTNTPQPALAEHEIQVLRRS